MAHPSVTVEVGWTESYPKLLRDIDVWMAKLSILIQICKREQSRLGGYLQVFRQNPAGGGYITEPSQDIFTAPGIQPQVIRITRGDLFGPSIMPGMNVGDIWELDIAALRNWADINGMSPLW